MKQTAFLIFFLLGIAQLLQAQEFSIDYTYDRSENSRFIQMGKMGLMDKNKKILIPALYDKVNDFYFGFARVEKNGKVGFVDKTAKEIIPCIYEKDTQMITGAVLEHSITADSFPLEILSRTITEVRAGFNENLFCVNKNGKYGYLNKVNKVVIPFRYDGADSFYGAIAIVKQKDKFGAINEAGKLVIPFLYDLLVWDFSTEASLYAEKDGKQFWINNKGLKINH